MRKGGEGEYKIEMEKRVETEAGKHFCQIVRETDRDDQKDEA